MIIKKHLIKIETRDNDDLFLFLASLFRRVQKKHPDYLKVVEVDESNQTILFMTTPYVGVNISRILMEEEQQFFWHDQKEGVVKVERLPYKVDG
jgi:hypothetical protein